MLRDLLADERIHKRVCQAQHIVSGISDVEVDAKRCAEDYSGSCVARLAVVDAGLSSLCT